MPAEISPRVEHPLFVVSTKADHARRCLGAKSQDAIDAAFHVRTAIDVVAQEDDVVAGPRLGRDLRQEVVERREIAVDIANRYGRHGEDYAVRLTLPLLNTARRSVDDVSSARFELAQESVW